MNALLVVLTIIEVIVSLFLIAVVLLQSGKNSGLSGALAGGGGDSFLARNKGKSLDAKLAKMTKWVAGAFLLITFLMNLV